MSKILTEALLKMPDGTMIPTIATLPDNPIGEVVFIIKESLHYIKKSGSEPSITIRNSIIETDDALGFINMFMFRDNEDLLYDCWLNYNNEISRRMLKSLCTQNRLMFEYRDSPLC